MENKEKKYLNSDPGRILNNRGLLFYQLPHLILHYSGFFKSDSELMLALMRNLEKDSSIGADDSILRKLREKSLTEEEVAKYFYNHMDFDIEPQFATDGKWILLRSLVRGIRLNRKKTVPDCYLDYLLYLCEIDEGQVGWRNIGRDKSQNFYDQEFLTQWLRIPTETFNLPEYEQDAILFISRIMYWAALFEHFAALDCQSSVTDSKPPFSFKNYLPTLKPAGKITSSNEVFLLRVKSIWGPAVYSKKEISWNIFCRDIETAISRELSPEKCPDAESIRKHFERVRSGKNLLTIKFYKNKIVPLFFNENSFPTYKPFEIGIELLIVIFIQLFDSFQREFLKHNVSPKFVIKQFERYPVYIDLVADQYKNYLEL